MSEVAVEWRVESRLIGYSAAVSMMKRRVDEVIKGSSSELIWLLEHSSVYTAGSNANSDELLMNDCAVPVFNAGRGGKYTYHGPGQRVIYPILNLKKRNLRDVRSYVLKLGSWIASVLKYFGVEARFDDDIIGVWSNCNGREEKIAALGIRIRKWVAYHGIAVNISPDLEYYRDIVPCGLRDMGVTSMRKMGVDVSTQEFDSVLYEKFYEIF